MRMYADMLAFYAADDRRGPSGEADYGSRWYLFPWRQPWRVSYIQDTGEIYAVNLDAEYSGRASHGPVFVLGTVEPDHRDPCSIDVYYLTLDRILAGWPKRCGQPESLLWVKNTLDAAGAQIA